MSNEQKLREALQKAKDALSLALSDVDWRKDSPTQPVIHKAYNCAHQALALPTAEQVDDINVAESFTSVTKTAAPAVPQEVGLTDDVEGELEQLGHIANGIRICGVHDRRFVAERIEAITAAIRAKGGKRV